MVKKDGMILEHPSLRVRKDGEVFEKTPFFNGKEVQVHFRKKSFILKRAREFRKQNSFPFKNS